MKEPRPALGVEVLKSRIERDVGVDREAFKHVLLN